MSANTIESNPVWVPGNRHQGESPSCKRGIDRSASRHPTTTRIDQFPVNLVDINRGLKEMALCREPCDWKQHEDIRRFNSENFLPIDRILDAAAGRAICLIVPACRHYNLTHAQGSDLAFQSCRSEPASRRNDDFPPCADHAPHQLNELLATIGCRRAIVACRDSRTRGLASTKVVGARIQLCVAFVIVGKRTSVKAATRVLMYSTAWR